MATPIDARTLPRILRDEGCRVVEVGNWTRHNRDHVGPFGPTHGVMIHHTVTSGSARTVAMCRDGYSGLPGPLCHGVITKDGTVHLISHRRANHAGLGDDDVLRAVIAERDLPPDNEANTDGNRYFYGFECENLGNGKDPWPEEQLDAIERAAAAICRHYRWTERSVIGHLEWQPGKIDPRGFFMASMRARIRARLAGPAQPPVEPDREIEWLEVRGFMPELRYGDESWHVGWLQRNLNRFLANNIKTDGVYGPDTARAVHWFYDEHLDYTTTTNGRVFGAAGWRRVLSIAESER